MPSEPIRFVNAIWVKAQSVIVASVWHQADLNSPQVFIRRVWIPRVTPSASSEQVLLIIEGMTDVPPNAIALVEVADA